MQEILKFISVPYLPLLGPVHPGCITPELVSKIFGAEGEPLPFDKERRWFDKKSERVLRDEIKHTIRGIVVPTIINNDHLKLYCYGEVEVTEKEAQSWAKRLLANTVDVIGFGDQLTEDAKCSIIFLKELSESDVSLPDQRAETVAADNAADLAVLAEETENRGFGFLSAVYAKRPLGPTFVQRQETRVIGAIGPIDVMNDSRGVCFCLPPYVGVSSAARGQGVASRLWKAAMNFATRQGAQYLILQAEAGAPAEKLYTSLGLRRLGVVWSHTYSL